MTHLIEKEIIDANTVRKIYSGNEGISEVLLQNADPLFEMNKIRRNAGYDKRAEVREVAKIPIALIEEWKVMYGFDWFKATQAEKMAILNDPAYVNLRTTNERV